MRSVVSRAATQSPLEVALSQSAVVGEVLKFVELKECGQALAVLGRRLTRDTRTRTLKVAVLDTSPSRVLDLCTEWRNDEFAMRLACEKQGTLLSKASDDLKDCFAVVKAAVGAVNLNEDEVLEFASETLRGHREIVELAVSTFGNNLKFATNQYRDDKSLVLSVVSKDSFGDCLAFASERLRNDREVVLAAVKHPYLDGDDGSEPLCHASTTLRGDREIVFAAVESRGLALEAASEALRGDRIIVARATKSHSGAFNWASEALAGCAYWCDSRGWGSAAERGAPERPSQAPDHRVGTMMI